MDPEYKGPGYLMDRTTTAFHWRGYQAGWKRTTGRESFPEIVILYTLKVGLP
jgi:hypothetical protein